MNKKFLGIILSIYLGIVPKAFCAQTDSQYFLINVPSVRLVTFMGGGVNSSINVDTGILSSAFSPTFAIDKNTSGTENLTLSVSANTQSGATNAIFSVGTTRYVALTNSTVLPTIAAVNDAKSAAPTATNNSNVIAYQIQNPTSTTGRLTVTFNTTNQNWNLAYRQRNLVYTTVNIPAAAPRINTFSSDDEAGSYKATITLSYN